MAFRRGPLLIETGNEMTSRASAVYDRGRGETWECRTVFLVGKNKRAVWASSVNSK